MHRLWEINEIVRLVLTNVGKGSSALALACCTKSLTDIVLDFLWEHVEDPIHLMKCLPPDSWEMCNYEFVRNPPFISLVPEGPH